MQIAQRECQSSIKKLPVEHKTQGYLLYSVGSILPASPNPAAESHLAPGGIPPGGVTSWREGEQENPIIFNDVDTCSFCNRGVPPILILIPLVGAAQSALSVSPPRAWVCCYGQTCLWGRHLLLSGTGCHSTSLIQD